MTPLRAVSALALAALLTACAGGGPPTSSAAPSPGSDAPAAGTLYSDAQAERGRTVFRATCSECHYSSEMRGEQFQFEWERRTVGDLLRTITRTMPDDAPGSLPAQDYLDVVAYVLRLNGFAPGPAELTAEGAALQASLRAPAR